MIVRINSDLEHFFIIFLDNPGPVDHLNHVKVVTLSTDDCKYTYGDQIGSNMFCAVGTYNEGTCIVSKHQC